jgi:hypothetical protein
VSFPFDLHSVAVFHSHMHCRALPRHDHAVLKVTSTGHNTARHGHGMRELAFKIPVILIYNSNLTFQSLAVTVCTRSANIQKIFILLPHLIYTFCMYLATNCEFRRKRRPMIIINNRDRKWLLRGRN